MKLGFFGVKWASSNTNGIFRNVGVKPAEDFIMPLVAVENIISDWRCNGIFTYLLPGLSTQWFSSGKTTRRLGTPRLKTSMPLSIITAQNGTRTYSCNALKAARPSVSAKR